MITLPLMLKRVLQIGSLVGGYRDSLTPFFRLPTIPPSRVPSTHEEFVIVVANEDLDSVRSLYIIRRQGISVYASHTLFRVGSLVSMVAVARKMSQALVTFQGSEMSHGRNVRPLNGAMPNFRRSWSNHGQRLSL